MEELAARQSRNIQMDITFITVTALKFNGIVKRDPETDGSDFTAIPASPYVIWDVDNNARPHPLLPLPYDCDQRYDHVTLQYVPIFHKKPKKKKVEERSD